MKIVISKAHYCQNVGKVSDQSATALKKLFPAFSSQCVISKWKRKFDPTKECVEVT